MTANFQQHIQEIYYDIDTYWEEYLSSYQGIGFFCSYVPLELVRACGFVPVRMLPSREELKEAALFLPHFACHPARSYIARRGREELPWFVEHYLFVETCDTMQCLANVWGMNFRDSRAFSLPGRLDTANALLFMQEQFRKMGRYLEHLSGNSIHEDDLIYWLDIYQKMRLNVRKAQHSLHLSPKQRYLLLTAAQRVPPEHLNDLLEKELAEEGSLEKPSPEKSTSLLLSGPVFYQLELLDELHEKGTYIFFDDLCHCKILHFESKQVTGNPWEQLAVQYRNMPQCPCKHRGPVSRLEYIKQLIREQEIDGVLFLLPKFCDPYFWDVVLLQEALKNNGIPSLQLELEESYSIGQVKTRLAAFKEILQGG